MQVPLSIHREGAFDSSDWAHEYINKAFDLGLTSRCGDYREAITMEDFAESAAYLVALKFGTTLNKYFNIVNYHAQLKSEKGGLSTPLEVAVQLGIIKGSGDGGLNMNSLINREEAAVMLARTYRAYGGGMPDTLKPLIFADRDNISSWAVDDVQLMTSLGIMTSVEDGRFNPQGSYTMEQCYVTLVRLYERTTASSKMKNPFAMTPRENVITDIFGYGCKLLYQFETKDYFILIWESGGGTMAGFSSYITVVDTNLFRRDYGLAVIEASNYFYGERTPRPENVFVSEDGTKLFYTATVRNDVYYNGFEDQGSPIQLKGIYTVTMDLKRGEQTYTRAELE